MRIGWALIGTGRVCDQMAGAIGRSTRARLVSVLSRDAGRGREFADRHDIGRVVTAVEDLVAQTEVDVVYVASPNGLHLAHVTTAAAAGKHVLCEKPMAMTAAEGRSMIEACERAGVRLGLAFQYRHAPAHRMLRDLVQSGGLGQPILADAAVFVPGQAQSGLAVPGWYAESALAGGGVIPMSGVHRIDLLRYILGVEVIEVAAMVDPDPVTQQYERAAAAVLRFADGAIATLRFGLDLGPGSDPVSIYGVSGSAEAVGTTSQWWGNDGGEIRVRGNGRDAVASYERTDLYLSQVDSFCESLTSGAPLVASGDDGLRAVEVVEAMYESAASHATVRVAS